MKRTLQAILVASALAAVVASGVPEFRALIVIARPLATFAAAMLASSMRDAVSPNYRTVVLVAITVALFGDFLAAAPGQMFVAELYCSAAVQLVLLVAYASQSPLAEKKVAVIAYALVVSPVLAAVYPVAVSTLRVPLALCIGATAFAAAQSASWMLVTKAPSARLAAIGGAWFVVSTATLIIHRFVHSIPFHDAVVMGSHWIALWCVARSVSRTGEL